MTKKISVVIGTYNLMHKLSLVLESFNYQTFPFEDFEVIIVDSNSNDGTKDFVSNFQSLYTLKFISKTNKGKASARNLGIQEATSQLIIITDADMIADSNFLAEHYYIQKKYNFSVLVEGKTWVLKEEKLPVTQYLRRPYITHKVKNEQKLGFYYCLTGNLSFPKRFYLKYGGFDEKFKNYGWEDIAFGYQLINKNNEKLLYCDKAINYHFHVWSDFEEMKRKENMGKSVKLLLNKHPELKMFLGINIFNFLIYLFLKYNNVLLNNWQKIVRDEKKISKWKKIFLREYFFQKGYRDEKNIY
jgi:glycosyltransferase involved in cell wall biosynthesis